MSYPPPPGAPQPAPHLGQGWGQPAGAPAPSGWGPPPVQQAPGQSAPAGQPAPPGAGNTGEVLLIIAAVLNFVLGVGWAVLGFVVHDRELLTKFALGASLATAAALIAAGVLLLLRLRAGIGLTITGAILGVLGAGLFGAGLVFEDDYFDSTTIPAILAGVLGIAALVLVLLHPLRSLFGRQRPPVYGPPPGLVPPGDRPAAYPAQQQGATQYPGRGYRPPGR